VRGISGISGISGRRARFGGETDEEKAARLEAEALETGAPQATPPPIVAPAAVVAPAPTAQVRTVAATPMKKPDCEFGRRLPTWQIVAVFMYLLIMLIGIALLIAYWTKWWNESKIYALLAILGIVVFFVLAIVTAVLAPCAPPPGDKS
jgi:hypothetical protein